MGRMINAIRPVRPDFSFLTGWDVVLVPMMLIGADGGTNATSGVVPELMRRIFDLCSDRKWDDAMPLQLRLIELFDAMLYQRGFPGRVSRGCRAARISRWAAADNRSAISSRGIAANFRARCNVS